MMAPLETSPIKLVAQAFKSLRKANGLTQSQLAELMDYSVSQVSRIEQGTRRLSPEGVHKLNSLRSAHLARGDFEILVQRVDLLECERPVASESPILSILARLDAELMEGYNDFLESSDSDEGPDTIRPWLLLERVATRLHAELVHPRFLNPDFRVTRKEVVLISRQIRKWLLFRTLLSRSNFSDTYYVDLNHERHVPSDFKRQWEQALKLLEFHIPELLDEPTWCNYEEPEQELWSSSSASERGNHTELTLDEIPF